MSNQSFRFLHVSDFRLDAVPRGLTEVPDHLRDILLDAPYNAARRVFDTALTERVAFVILAGNILQPDLAGPRGTAFLCEQFQRLADAEISVYWAGGQTDPPESWPTAFPLPENVRVFAKDRVTDFLHQCDGSPLARIVGTSHGARAFRPAEFSPDAVGLFSIGAACLPAGTACGEAESADLQSQRDGLETHPVKSDRLKTCPTVEAETAGLQSRGIDYWALGGRVERTTLFNSPGIAHYPGAPQGRSPADVGTHGCTLVNVDDQGRARMSFIAANAMEWLHETVLIDSATRRENLEAMFTQRIHSLTQGSKTDLLVTWTIGGNGPLLAELRRGKLRGDLLEWLRIEHGLSSPVVWTVGIELESQNALPASLCEQETILGDFLRTLREFELDPQQPLNVESLLADGQAAGVFSQAVAIADPAARKRALREAALLAVELLGGDGKDDENNARK
ncbi:MAG: metallophosphoesterase family protein [Thermoguttaceae bacterium]